MRKILRFIGGLLLAIVFVVGAAALAKQLSTHISDKIPSETEETTEDTIGESENSLVSVDII